MTNDIEALAKRCEEAADRVAKRAMGHDAPALISIPRQPTDVDAVLAEAAAALRRMARLYEMAVHNRNHYADERKRERDAAKARIAELTTALRGVVEWLESPELGKWSYMESSEFYSDKDVYLAICRATLARTEKSDG